MKYIITFENYTTPIPKAVTIEQESTLMDKNIDKEITQEEKKKLIEEDKEEEIKRKKSVKHKKVNNKPLF